jgi:hypothetical protein
MQGPSPAPTVCSHRLCRKRRPRSEHWPAPPRHLVPNPAGGTVCATWVYGRRRSAVRRPRPTDDLHAADAVKSPPVCASVINRTCDVQAPPRRSVCGRIVLVMKLRLFRGRARRRRHAVVDLKGQSGPGARAYRVCGRVRAAFRCEGVFDRGIRWHSQKLN